VIAAVLSGALAIALPRVVELPIESASIVSVVAVAPIASLEEDQLCAIQNLCDSVRNGTKGFTRKELVEYGQQAGVPIEASITGDFITVQVAAPKGKLSIALSVMASILCEPMIDQDHWEEFCSTAGSDNAADWDLGLWARRQWSKLPSLEFVKWVHGSAFKQERFTLGIGGSYDRATVLDDVRAAFLNYEAVRTSSRPPRHPGRVERIQPGKVQVHSIEGIIGGPSDRQAWIAMNALAGGKTSVAYDELREKQGSTYRLEGFLEWRQAGPTFRLALAALPGTEGLSRAAITDAIRKRVDSLSVEDVKIAATNLQAMAKAWMPRTLFRVRQNSGFDGSVTDRTRWVALCAAAKAILPEPEALATAASEADLAAVKAAAFQWLDKASYSVSGPKSG